MAARVTPKRILLIRPSALGDVCRTVPVLASLRHAWPDAEIDWVVQDSFRSAIEAHPALTSVIEFPRSRFASWWRNPSVAWEMKNWFATIRRKKYDLVVDAQGLGRSGLISFSSGASMRLGLRSARELGWLGYNQRVSCPSDLHTVDQMMSLITHLGIEPVYDMQLHVSEDARQWWGESLHEQGLTDRTYVVLAPTSRWPSKRWPEENFARLVDPLLERGYAGIVLVGAPNEQDQVRRIVETNADGTKPLVDLVGRTTLAQTLAIIERSALVIAEPAQFTGRAD